MTGKWQITSRVSRVDDNDSSDIAMLAGFLDGAFQFTNIQTPIVVFVQVITDLFHVVLDNRRRVERILRSGDHDACLGSADC